MLLKLKNKNAKTKVLQAIKDYRRTNKVLREYYNTRVFLTFQKFFL